MILFYSTALVIFMIVLGANTYKYIKDLFTYERPDSPMLLLMMSATMQIAHIAF